MADKFVSERNLRFLLYEVFDAPKITQYPYYAEHNRESFDMALDTAMKIGKNLMKPKLTEMDKNPPEFVSGKVKVHPMVRGLMKECGEGDWIGAPFSFELGGQQLPLMISGACRFILSAANYSASVYPFLTTGAAHLLLSFGSPEMIEARSGSVDHRAALRMQRLPALRQRFHGLAVILRRPKAAEGSRRAADAIGASMPHDPSSAR